jgi:two-component system, LytTR family, response regulator
MDRIRTIIADDEPFARELLREMLEEHRDIEVVAECGDGRAVVDTIRSTTPDLVFLDIRMPGLDGFEVVEAIGEDAMPLFIFVTAYDEYALRAFEAHAADYVLKPFDEDRLQQALSRLRKRGDLSRTRTAQLIEDLHGRGRYRDRLAIRTGDRTTFLQTSQIDWIEADGKHVRVHAGGQVVKVPQGLTQFEEQLDPECFVRVNRSTIVRIDGVREVRRWFKGEHLLVLGDGTELATGRVYRDRVEAALGLR